MKIQQGSSKTFNLTLITTALLLSSHVLYAGRVLDVPVTVDTANKIAYGNMKTARYSDNDVELIGCGSRTYSDPATGSSFYWGFCRATTGDGTSVVCTAYDNQVLVEQIRAAASYSYITFRWNDDGDCISVSNSTQSFYLPKNADES
jgi:hypothetical protein